MESPVKVSKNQTIQMYYYFFSYLVNAIICFLSVLWVYMSPDRGRMIHLVFALIALIHICIRLFLKQFFGDNSPEI